MRLHSQVSETRVKQVLEEFQGPLYQRPPVRSAVKRQLRIRTVYYNDFIGGSRIDKGIDSRRSGIYEGHVAV